MMRTMIEAMNARAAAIQNSLAPSQTWIAAV